MPSGYECKTRLIKQNPPTFTVSRRKKKPDDVPAPNAYEPPGITGGPGYSNIKREPAYTFGHLTPLSFAKPVASRKAALLDLTGTTRKGPCRIPGGVVCQRGETEPVIGKRCPGPGDYSPRHEIQIKRPPAYSMAPAARPPWQPFDMWTPSANMYWPAIPGKSIPAFTHGERRKPFKQAENPGPGEHDPKSQYKSSAFSFGASFRPDPIPTSVTPAPNEYCQRKFLKWKHSAPAPSFGIKHSPYLGTQTEYLKDPKLTFLGQD